MRVGLLAVGLVGGLVVLGCITEVGERRVEGVALTPRVARGGSSVERGVEHAVELEALGREAVRAEPKRLPRYPSLQEVRFDTPRAALEARIRGYLVAVEGAGSGD